MTFVTIKVHLVTYLTGARVVSGFLQETKVWLSKERVVYCVSKPTVLKTKKNKALQTQGACAPRRQSKNEMLFLSPYPGERGTRESLFFTFSILVPSHQSQEPRS